MASFKQSSKDGVNHLLGGSSQVKQQKPLTDRRFMTRNPRSHGEGEVNEEWSDTISCEASNIRLHRSQHPHRPSLGVWSWRALSTHFRTFKCCISERQPEEVCFYTLDTSPSWMGPPPPISSQAVDTAPIVKMDFWHSHFSQIALQPSANLLEARLNFFPSADWD